MRCLNCSVSYSTNQQRELAQHNGPEFDHWRRRSLAALGVFLPPVGDGEFAADER